MQIQRSFFTIDETFTLRLPRKAKILHVDTLANGAHAIWTEVDSTTDTVDHVFMCFETGETIEPHDGTYVGTVIAAGAITEHHIYYHGSVEPESE